MSVFRRPGHIAFIPPRRAAFADLNSSSLEDPVSTSRMPVQPARTQNQNARLISKPDANTKSNHGSAQVEAQEHVHLPYTCRHVHL